MSTIGKINEEFCHFNVIEWSIEDFCSLSVICGARYDSPSFSFADESWCLRMYPNGDRLLNSGYIYLYLCRISSGPPITMEYSFGLKNVEKKIDFRKHMSSVFQWFVTYSGPHKLLSRKELFERQSELFPSDTLVLVCSIKHSTFCEREGFTNTEAVQCSCCNKTLDAHEDIQSHLRKCEDLPIKCKKCDEDVALKNWYDHKCQMTETKDDAFQCQDFKEMLLRGKNHDLTLKVGDKEFRVHQDVLRARSRVFKSMLDHDMKEKESGVIDIPDCDPQAMEQFLLYVYCGKVEILDQSNMLGLYYIADKYEMQSLKEECCDFIKKSLSHSNICKVIQLALTHSDTSLQEYATGYFMDNTLDIMLTVEWQSFLQDNATIGNELLIKSFRKLKGSKN